MLRAEADCRLGQTPNGAAVDINSNVCQAILSQVVRNPPTDQAKPNGITSVMVLPINAAVDKTSGIDFSAHYALTTERFGNFDFNLGITDVLTHTIQQYEGDPGVNELDNWYDYVIPRYKATYSVGWTKSNFTATVHDSHLGGLPNYNGDTRLGSTDVYNASANYRFGPHMALTIIIDNLFDTKPGKDNTWTSYPYYSGRWFSPVGRAFFAQFNYRMGGSAGN